MDIHERKAENQRFSIKSHLSLYNSPDVQKAPKEWTLKTEACAAERSGDVGETDVVADGHQLMAKMRVVHKPSLMSVIDWDWPATMQGLLSTLKLIYLSPALPFSPSLCDKGVGASLSAPALFSLYALSLNISVQVWSPIS